MNDTFPDPIIQQKWDELVRLSNQFSPNSPSTGLPTANTNLTLIAQDFSSSNYKSGTTGWIIKSNGDVEFSDGVFRGSISATVIDIGGSDASSFHVDIDGNLWSGASTFASAPFKVSNIGSLTASGIDVSGAIVIDSGSGIANLSDAGDLATLDQVDTAQIVDSAIETAKLNDLAVTTGKIALLAVQTAQIDALAVTTAKIDNLAVTNAKINDLAVSKLTAGTISSKSIELAVSGGTGDVEIRSGIATGDFANTGAASGFILGVDDSDSDKAKFYIGSSSNYLSWNGSALSINGSITSTDGTIGGWTLGTNSLIAGSGSATVGLDSTVTAGDDVRIYAGSATPSDAPFQVRESGQVTATNAILDGVTVYGSIASSSPFKLPSYLVADLPTVPVASTGVDDSSVGTISWTNPSNATGNDDSTFASAEDSSDTLVTTHYLKITDMGYSVPSDATIVGIVVEIIKNAPTGFGLSDCRDKEVRLIKADGTLGSENKADTSTQWPSNQGPVFSYGSPTDLWGETWTPADINDVDFGAVISAQFKNNALTTKVILRTMRVLVYYTGGTIFPSSGSIAYASDGRKASEASSQGKGVMVFFDGRAWKACDTGATVSA